VWFCKERKKEKEMKEEFIDTDNQVIVYCLERKRIIGFFFLSGILFMNVMVKIL